MRALPETIDTASGDIDVSTLTVLKAFTNLGWDYHTLLFVMVNKSASDNVTMLVETSEDGVYPDGLVKWERVAAPLKQVSLELGPWIMRRYWRVSAYSDSPGFPTVPVSWSIRGAYRRGG